MSAPFRLIAEMAPGAGPFDEIGESWLRLTGDDGDSASTPDTATLDITGDIDIRVEASASWHEITTAPRQTLIGKWDVTGNNRSYAFILDRGVPTFIWSDNGTQTRFAQAGRPGGTDGDSILLEDELPLVAVPIGFGRIALRVTVGIVGSTFTVTFYSADDLDGSWTQLADPTSFTLTTPSMFSGTADLEIGFNAAADAAWGSVTNTLHPLQCKIWRAEVRDGIDGTVVADPDFRALAAGTTSFSDDAGLTWTVNGDAAVQRYDWVELEGDNKLLAAKWSFGRDDELEQFPSGEASLRFKNDNRDLDPTNTSGTYAGKLLPRLPVRLRSQWSALNISDGTSSLAGTPDRAEFAVTDLDVRTQVAPDDWTPDGLGRFLATHGAMPDLAWRLHLLPSGLLRLTFTTDGNTAQDRDSTAATGFDDGSDHWVRATLDVDDGAGNHVVTFYTSVDGVEWDQLGNPVATAGTVTIWDSSADLTAGAAAIAAGGQMRQLEVRDGIDGTVVANPDFMSQTPGATEFDDGSGNTWTLSNATVAIDESHLLNEFSGFVDRNGFEQQMDPPASLVAAVDLVDLVGVLGAGYVLPGVFDHAITSRSPAGYWPLDSEDASETIQDLGTEGNDGTVIGGVQFSQAPLGEGHSPSALFPGDGDSGEGDRIDVSRSPIIADALSSSDATVIATFATNDEPTFFRTLFYHGDGTAVDDRGKRAVILLAGDGSLRWVVAAGSGFSQGKTWPNVADGRGHIVFCQTDTFFGVGLAVDTDTLDDTNASTTTPTKNGVSIGGIPGLHPVLNWQGRIGFVALWARSIGGGERALIFAARTKLDGETSGTHIAWGLDRVGIPLSFRNIDDGTVIMGPANTGDRGVIDWAREVTATEQGEFFYDHRSSVVRFRDRYHRFLNSRSTTAQETFSDDPAATNVVRPEQNDLVWDPQSAEGLINQAQVRWADGEVVREDTASVDQFGPEPRTTDTQATTATQARSVADWQLTRYSQPRDRARQVGVYPSAARLGFRTVRNLQIGDRASIRFQPNQVGSVMTADVFIEGGSHEVEGVDWRTTYSVAPVDTFTPWIWGTSAWDTTAIWG